MSFMQKQVTSKRKWYELETNCGTFFVDVDDVDGGKFAASIAQGIDLDSLNPTQREKLAKEFLQYTEASSLEHVSVREGYGARLSAPGYLDCTEWTVFDSVDQANEYLNENFPDEEEEED